MDLSIAHPMNSSSTIFAEIALSQNTELQDGEQPILPEKLLDPEMFKELANLAPAKGAGTLRGETEVYTFTLQESTTLSQSLCKHVKDSNSLHKGCDSKKFGEHQLSFKETQVQQKDFQIHDVQSQSTNQKTREEPRQDSCYKIEVLARRILEKARLPESARTLKETPAQKQQVSLAKSIEHKVLNTCLKKEHTDTHPAQTKHLVKNENTRHEKPKESDTAQHTRNGMSVSTNTKEPSELKPIEQKREEEEGFADKDRDQNHEESSEALPNTHKAAKIDGTFAKEFADYADQASILTELFNLRVSQFDVLILFIEILKLEIRNREQERIARQQERELQILHMQNVMENYKSQGNWTMFSSLGSGILAIVSGFCPIIGHTNGDWILKKLGSIFSSLRTMDKEKFFEGVTKITFGMSEMYKNTGQIHNTFAEGHRLLDQHMSDLHRMDWEENTRTMEEIKESWRSIENFLYQSLQMYHDAIRQLYN